VRRPGFAIEPRHRQLRGDPMTAPATIRDAGAALAPQRLRHVAILKQLVTNPKHVTVHRVSGAQGPASAWDRKAYSRGEGSGLHHRRQGLEAGGVRTALAALAVRKLAPRCQVEEDNAAAIALAGSVGFAPFLAITHYVHAC